MKWVGLALLLATSAFADLKVRFSSLYVSDQDRALKFYTEKLGFLKKSDIAFEGARWLTVVSPSEPDGTELVLESNKEPLVEAFQKGLYAKGVPLTSLEVTDLDGEYERLTGLGVVFKQPPIKIGASYVATLEDTVGNLIQLHQK
jgi:predicted enzyme related to lactoylglutathione lyase